MAAFVVLPVTHLELQELREQLGAASVIVEQDSLDRDKAYDIGQLQVSLEVTVPALAALAAWLWAQRKDGRVVEEILKIKNSDGSILEKRVKYKASDPMKAISELVTLLRDLFSAVGS
jgi:hypothetical protein